MRKRHVLAALCMLPSLAVAAVALAQESLGRSVELPPEPGPHWIWVSDAILRRAVLVDGDDARFLGQVPGGVGIVAPHRAADGSTLYTAETYFARGTRGARSDVVSFRDARTLAVTADVEIPAKRSEHTSWVAGSALSDDGRFLAVFNLNPATSLTIVDTAERRVAGEIEIPGCALVYSAGARRFFSLCADGTALVVTLDERGALASKQKSERFFDPQADPVIEKGVRRGDQWLFASFEGVVHTVDTAGAALRFDAGWRLTGDAERAESWRVGGMQPLGVHASSGRLFALMHQGGVDSHKQPGTEVWVFDMVKRERVQRIALRSPTASFVLERTEQAPGGVFDWLLQRALPNEGVERIAVTQDAAPLLFAAAQLPPTLSVYDATRGDHVRDVPEIGIAPMLLQPY